MNEELKDRIDQTPQCLVGASKNYTPNAPIILAEQEVLLASLRSGSMEPIQVQGDIFLKLKPKPRLVIKLESEERIFFENFNSEQILKVSLDSFDMYCRVTRMDQNNFGKFSIILSSIDDKTHTKNMDGLNYATFDVLNFPMCLGVGVRGRNNSNFFYKSRLKIQDESWKIIFDKVENYKTVQEKLKLHDGFGVTYVGRIEKLSGQPFHSQELDQVINKVYYFLSFARGANSPVFNFKAYNNQDEMVWQDWSIRRSARWSLTQNNWFCDQHSFDQLSDLFPQWSKLFEDELWSKEIPKILYWYLYSGRNTEGAGTDGSLVLAIAALELFSYNYLVRHTSLRSKDKYESKKLSNNIYKMLEELDITDELPANLEKLHGYALQENWQGGPKAIVEIRNEIVHPGRESLPNSHVCYEALQLALWYIEMVILKLCNYEDVYSNRLSRMKWAGEVEQVPWAKKE